MYSIWPELAYRLFVICFPPLNIWFSVNTESIYTNPWSWMSKQPYNVRLCPYIILAYIWTCMSVLTWSCVTSNFFSFSNQCPEWFESCVRYSSIVLFTPLLHFQLKSRKWKMQYPKMIRRRGNSWQRRSPNLRLTSLRNTMRSVGNSNLQLTQRWLHA